MTKTDEENIGTSMGVRKKQLKLFLALFGSLAALILLFCLLGNSKKVPVTKEKIGDDAILYDVTRAVDDKSYWVFESERKLAEQAQQQTKLLNQIEEIRHALKHDTDKEMDLDAHELEIKVLKEHIAELEAKLAQQTEINHWDQPKDLEKEPLHATATTRSLQHHYLPTEEDYVAQSPISGQSVFSSPTIFSETITLEGHSEEQAKHIDSYIPANAYAGARLLNGADVSAGVSSQTNPQPLTLRITDNGSLPNHMMSKLHDCRVSVAAHGDLSSERVFMRLENLTCVEPDGHPIETDVEGYVVGRDGKNGVRGKMAIRDGEMLKRGFMGGFLSGLGKATAQSFGTTSISPLGAMSTLQGAEMMKSSSAEGVGNAFELLARYNIQRAEQYQPVIQISGGESVHVVFHKGSKLGEKRIKKEEPKQSAAQKSNMFFGEPS